MDLILLAPLPAFLPANLAESYLCFLDSQTLIVRHNQHYAPAHRHRRRSRYGNRRLQGYRSFRAFQDASALRLLLRRAFRRKEELYRRASSHMRRPTSRSDRHSLRAPTHGCPFDHIISEAATFVKTGKEDEKAHPLTHSTDPTSQNTNSVCRPLFIPPQRSHQG